MPPGLAIAEHKRLAEGVGVQLRDLLEEDSKGARDVFDPLSLQRRGCKAREIDRMPGPERVADLAEVLKAANTGPLPGTRIDDEDGALSVVDLNALRRDDAY